MGGLEKKRKKSEFLQVTTMSLQRTSTTSRVGDVPSWERNVEHMTTSLHIIVFHSLTPGQGEVRTEAFGEGSRIQIFVPGS